VNCSRPPRGSAHASYRYRFVSGGHADSLLYVEASSAFYSAVTDLHDGSTQRLAIDRDGQPWEDRAVIDCCYAACRADLEARPDAVPRALEQLGAWERGEDASTG
jgi:hypothetical protein